VDDAVRQALTAAGWTPDRDVEANKDTETLAENGHPVWPALIFFLREFTGLTVSFVRNGREDYAWFSADRACRWIKRDWIKQYEPVVGSRLSPVGYGYHDHMVLLAAEDGRYIGAYDEFIGLLGRSAYEMIGNLIDQRIEPLT
jgi:hypothetical protein